MPVIGVLNFATADSIPHLLAAFRRGLTEVGYVEGKNVAIEYRFADFKLEHLPEAMRDLIRLNVNAIFAATPEAVAAAGNATRSIPVVALDLESDPLVKGYVKSLARPGSRGNGGTGACARS
jgi:putative tryptophan/tyrosine transport system substrate-binding protein